MEHTTYFPEETIVHRVVAGHIVTAEGPVVARPWNVPRSIAPGGGIISTVRDQLAYAAFHLGDGTAPSGERLLSRERLSEMQRPHARAGSMCDEVGVTWMLFQAGGVSFVAHGGATNGHLSAFELAPSRGFACTVLTNADTGRGLRPFAAALLRKHFLGIEQTPPIPWAAGPSDRAPYTGSYQMTLALLLVEAGQGEGELIIHETAPVVPGRVTPLPTPPSRCVFVGPDRVAAVEGPRLGETAEFLRGADGGIAWMRWDGRIARRLN
jgi:CubicO group peptidase (beta-lactamase class C family)